MLSRSPGFAALVVARAVSVVGDGIGTLALILHVQADQGTGTAIGLRSWPRRSPAGSAP